MSDKTLKICVVGTASAGKTSLASLVARILESHEIPVDFIDQDGLNIMDDDRIMNGIGFLKNEYKDGLVVETMSVNRSGTHRKNKLF